MLLANIARNPAFTLATVLPETNVTKLPEPSVAQNTALFAEHPDAATNWSIVWRYRRGVDPEKLARAYRG